MARGALLIFICSQLYAQPQVCNNVQWLTGNPDLVQCQLGQWAFSFILSISNVMGKNPEKKNSATPPPSVAAKEWKTTTHDAGRLAALKQLPLTKPNPMLGSILRFPSLTVSYCTLANKHVTTDARAYHCLRHDLSSFLR